MRTEIQLLSLFLHKLIKSKLLYIIFNELEKQKLSLYFKRQQSYNSTYSQRNFEFSLKNLLNGYELNSGKLHYEPIYQQFQYKLNNQNPEFENIISFNSAGNAFIVKDQNGFSDYVLPKQFKHQNFSSFIRQLNMYGFKKIRNVNNQNQFSHHYFLKDREDLLQKIIRKNSVIQRFHYIKLQNKAKKEVDQLNSNYLELKTDIEQIQKELIYFYQQFDQFQSSLSTLIDSSRQQIKELSIIKNQNSFCNDLLFQVLSNVSKSQPEQNYHFQYPFVNSTQQTQTTKSNRSDKDELNNDNENNNNSSKEDTNQSFQSNSFREPQQQQLKSD
ncbi:unnamed protein product [Paramecium pentaurelia]|uniref:HSF-type DNA-binding domain-containing protein n=1 Tax=Paramecium pentaurelia TaxID=43138 RepID=A0A8S1WNL6_9CILI|nr:unnamed protein product [Paramecium pentaurelia]